MSAVLPGRVAARILHPARTVERTPASAGIAYSDVRFGASETGQPGLTAWWIPAASQDGFQPKNSAYTVLYLHDGSGSLADTVPVLARLHGAGLNVFALDYRGFGASAASVHPSEARMTEDSGAALAYITSTLHTPARDVIPYGTGLGASLAAGLAQGHAEIRAVVLDNPDPDPAATAFAAHPSRWVPVKLLFGDQFDIGKPISGLSTPKLLIAGGLNAGTKLEQVQSLFPRAASPSFKVTLPPQNDEAAYLAALNRFLDQYLR